MLDPAVELELRTREVKAREEQTKVLAEIAEHLKLLTNPQTMFEIVESVTGMEYGSQELAVQNEIKAMLKTGNYDGWETYDLRKRAIQILKGEVPR